MSNRKRIDANLLCLIFTIGLLLVSIIWLLKYYNLLIAVVLLVNIVVVILQIILFIISRKECTKKDRG